MIRQVLKEVEHLLTNIEISYDGKKAEMDSVVVSKFGVFIFEVKNYSGQLIGDEDDYEWQKIKITDAGNMYAKQVKNPIRQLKRQYSVKVHGKIYVPFLYVENGMRTAANRSINIF